MAANVLTRINSVANHFLAELRSETIQKDAMRFRKNLERLGEILSYEISKTFVYKEEDIRTTLGIATPHLTDQKIVLAVLLRAGVPFFQGFLNYFDKAESAFIAAYRGAQEKDYSFKIKMDYMAAPAMDKKTLILIDPMLATGKSLVEAYHSICSHGAPSHVHIASIISSQTGIDYLQEHIPNHTLWTCAIDEELNHKSYIVPGLGDAGDLSFGEKL